MFSSKLKPLTPPPCPILHTLSLDRNSKYMHLRSFLTAMAPMYCIKPWALYDKVNRQLGWEFSSLFKKDVVVCRLSRTKNSCKTGITTESKGGIKGGGGGKDTWTAVKQWLAFSFDHPSGASLHPYSSKRAWWNWKLLLWNLSLIFF